jgi:hypothetical protein
MLEPYKPNRKALLIAACFCLGAAITLLVLRPLPPVDVVTAIMLVLFSSSLVFHAFFPRQVERNREKVERALEKGPSDHMGRWVP